MPLIVSLNGICGFYRTTVYLGLSSRYEAYKGLKALAAPDEVGKSARLRRSAAQEGYVEILRATKGVEPFVRVSWCYRLEAWP
jgi:hypothetical protein